MNAKLAYKVPIRNVKPGTAILALTPLHSLISSRSGSCFFNGEKNGFLCCTIGNKIGLAPVDKFLDFSR